MKIIKPKRNFVHPDLNIDSWDVVQPYFNQLLERDLNSMSAFKNWLSDKSELEAVLEEDAAWRYIKMTIDTRDQKLTDSYNFFITQIQPKMAPYEDELNKKLVATPFFTELDAQKDYHIYFKSVKTALDLYREENIPIEAELNEKSQEYGAIAALQTIEYEGEQITMQKASSLLREPDEKLRKSVFEKMADRRRLDIEKLDLLYTELIQKRHQLALNAGFKNYRDYKFQELGRFDYSKEDCFEFHQSIKNLVVPLVKEIKTKQLKKLGKDKFKPWDTEVDPEGKKPLKPFINGSELLKGTIEIFQKIDPYFAQCIQTMEEMGHLDLESKLGKAPGGYNYPLYEIGVPFIFMNAVGTQNDLVTMVHEGGHAVHSFLSRELKLTSFKNLPSEVAELASMSMELLSMEEWSVFYKKEDDLNRAKKNQLESIMTILPWIAQIDEFQHWVYTHPTHSVEERHKKWMELNAMYSTGLTDWTGFEDIYACTWQRQLHLFEVPFYYIEYGIAQLGALSIWKNSLVNKQKSLEDYKKALAVGYTQTIPEIYKTANISFNFKESHLIKILDFVKKELEQLEK